MSAGKVVVYAGAGISLTAPTGLPSGAALSRTIYAQLKDAIPFSEQVDENDLVAVADAAASAVGGEPALLQVSSRAADFQSATPGYAHRILAHLMLEGVIDVLTTNWDTCIERSAGEEQLVSVVSEGDLQTTAPPSILKIHGCATRPNSLLITSAHLSHPPRWVSEQTHARLGSAVVVFLGIGDVAGYVRQRLTEVVQQVDARENIRVVSPSISSRWDESQWSAVAPDLLENHRIGNSADEFADAFAAAYVQAAFKQHGIPLQSEAGISETYEKGVAVLVKTDPLRVLRWARQIDIKHRAGRSVLRSTETARALVALGHLADGASELDRDARTIKASDGPIEVLVATETVPKRALAAAAEARHAEHLNEGSQPPRFLLSGGVGSIPRSVTLPQDIVARGETTDILNGPQSGVPALLDAEELIAS